MVTPSTLTKGERITGRKLTETLFNGTCSRSLVTFPIRVVYMKQSRQQDAAPVQLLVSVPKRHFRHAVDRNRVKRQLREAFRLNKAILHEAVPEGEQLLVAFLWLSDSQMASAEVGRRVVSLMRRVAEKI